MNHTVITWAFLASGRFTGSWKGCWSYRHGYTGYPCSTTCRTNWATTQFSPCTAATTIRSLQWALVTCIRSTLYVWISVTWALGVAIHHINCSLTTISLMWGINSITDIAINVSTKSVRTFRVLPLVPCLVCIFTYCMHLTHFSSCEGFISWSFPLHCGFNTWSAKQFVTRCLQNGNQNWPHNPAIWSQHYLTIQNVQVAFQGKRIILFQTMFWKVGETWVFSGHMKKDHRWVKKSLNTYTYNATKIQLHV